MTVLEDTLPGVKNLNVEVTENNGTILFLHKIVEGSASRSYGIHVARLAGVPDSLLLSAERKLEELENFNNADGSCQPISSLTADSEAQLSIFSPTDYMLAEKIKALDLMNVTPSQAIQILEQLQNTAKDR